jgi:hypothetical protein
MVRRSITDRLGAAGSSTFQFHADRCDRVVKRVLTEIRRQNPAP